jgi:hypothetical protein
MQKGKFSTLFSGKNTKEESFLYAIAGHSQLMLVTIKRIANLFIFRCADCDQHECNQLVFALRRLGLNALLNTSNKSKPAFIAL